MINLIIIITYILNSVSLTLLKNGNKETPFYKKNDYFCSRNEGIPSFKKRGDA